MPANKICLFMIIVITTAAQGRAATKSLQFTGNVTTVPASLASQFTVGQPISGTYTFDTLASDEDPSVQTGRYFLSVTPFKVSIGNYSTSGPLPGDIEVTDGLQDAYIAVSLATGNSINGATPVLQAIQLNDPTGTALSSTTLPEALDVTRFAARDFTLDFDNGARLIGQVNAIFVPEPVLSSGLLLTLGLCARRARRRV